MVLGDFIHTESVNKIIFFTLKSNLLNKPVKKSVLNVLFTDERFRHEIH